MPNRDCCDADFCDCCAKKGINSKCNKCYNKHRSLYRRERIRKKRGAENSKIKTCGALMAKRSKYASALCFKCKDSTLNAFCSDCKSEYKYVSEYHYRKNQRQKRFMQGRILDELDPVNVTPCPSVDTDNSKLNNENYGGNTGNPQLKKQIDKENTSNPLLNKQIESKYTDNPQLNKINEG